MLTTFSTEDSCSASSCAPGVPMLLEHVVDIEAIQESRPSNKRCAPSLSFRSISFQIRPIPTKHGSAHDWWMA